MVPMVQVIRLVRVVRWSGGQVVRWSGGQVVRWSGGQRDRVAPLVRVIGVDSPRYLQSLFLRHVDSNP